MSGVGVVVLAAGLGTRMRSRLPKVLHPVCGAPMAWHVIEAACALAPARIVVVTGHEAERVEAALAADDVRFVRQEVLDGTAGAVRRCEGALAGCETVVVLNGDAPLARAETLRQLIAARAGRPLAFAVCRLAEPGRMGRVVRDADGEAAAVVEAAEYEGPDGPAEVNAGLYAFDAAWLWAKLPQVPVGAKGEYYLTHLVAMAAAEGRPAATVTVGEDEALGVDDRVKLAQAEALMRRRILERHMLAGVTIEDPATTFIGALATLGQDVTVLAGSRIEGRSEVAEEAVIGPNTTLRNARVGRGTRVEASVVEDSAVGAGCSVGPFAHIRGGAVVGDDCEVHNYAEVKNSRLGNGVKMHHFSYLGDADVGEGTNIGAGTITCNYDGVAKHRTVIGRGVFVGSDTMLVAPVRLGDGAFTATGAVVTRDVPAGGSVRGVPAKPFERKERRPASP
ncbi:bifunctional UDP-N-acetylglucosamine diphosphorylase/glucosamine-1-phosphate N-acetyltransferase GlmU [Tepidiforma sp.]|uniref:bifunctional UDP-N-acetylglucosamine diphosphorylase/glucosamine-1-phosphate N-acetyltransferase GlmU n=1 Tax=Tepidiforma sp. TaxID=2682230 RepID=UPI0026221E74|nr:bifunctional UDP-N-acetylglucosamine diphosphorylase/glucosamine-1-phosphate N-acetyltransferase GlmU [Tepidiforma sp.]MCX7616354.1 bifunctional UDP-N-acetylglucosamine diphosphorylase/glucosamine-1-phosphate N-acetyltransferase GlmU [Tepidiforma sp.]